ncbi:MAG: hypothetical protein WCI79_02080 [Candidatus Saccharibacteria bacterium]
MNLDSYKGIPDTIDSFAEKLGEEYGIGKIPRKEVHYCFIVDLETIDLEYQMRYFFFPKSSPKESAALNARTQQLLKEECAKRKEFISIWGIRHYPFLLMNEGNLQILNDELLKSATVKMHFDMLMGFNEVNSPTWLKAAKGWEESKD